MSTSGTPLLEVTDLRKHFPVHAGLLRRQFAYGLGWAIQVVALGLGVVISVMYVLGTVFLVLWATAFFLGAKIEREQAEWLAAHPEHAGSGTATSDGAS